MEKIVKGFLGLFGGLTTTVLGKRMFVFIISLMPILELRGGLLAARIIDLDPVSSYIVAVIGNVIPIPFILWFMGAILKWMKKRKRLKKVANWIDKKVEKNREKIERFGFWGLVLFVGIPLPGTGAWTGCLVASVLEMDKKKSFIAAMIGVFMASLIMMIISFGFLGSLLN